MIKKFARPFANGSIAKLVLKEIKTLKHLKHDNVGTTKSHIEP
jgi:hypothetical protein